MCVCAQGAYLNHSTETLDIKYRNRNTILAVTRRGGFARLCLFKQHGVREDASPPNGAWLRTMGWSPNIGALIKTGF